jgi:hypothetical protein
MGGGMSGAFQAGAWFFAGAMSGSIITVFVLALMRASSDR